MNNFTKPTDPLEKMVSNFKEGKPILEGAQLYRGTRLPDQALGHFGADLHTSLLPQVAASYTHNWKAGGEAYIGTYPIDRENTRFHSDFGMEKVGASKNGYSVAEVERALEPLVSKMANAANPADRAKASEMLEKQVMHSFYEAGVPSKTQSGEPNRPQQLYVYDGRPDTSNRAAVAMQMRPMTLEAEKTARLTLLSEHKSESMQQMVSMLAKRNEASPAVAVMLDIASRDHGKDIMKAHATKPLGQLMNDLHSHPATDLQERVGKFAKAIQAGVEHPNPDIRNKAQDLAKEISKLDPAKATFGDLQRISGEVSAKHAGQSSAASSTSQKSDLGGHSTSGSSSHDGGGRKDMGGSNLQSSNANKADLGGASTGSGPRSIIKPDLGGSSLQSNGNHKADLGGVSVGASRGGMDGAGVTVRGTEAPAKSLRESLGDGAGAQDAASSQSSQKTIQIQRNHGMSR